MDKACFEIEKFLITKLPKKTPPDVIFVLAAIISLAILAVDLIFKGACLYVGLYAMAKLLE